MANKFKIPELISKVDFAIKDAIAIVARDSEAHFKKSFANEGFIDESFSPWKRLKVLKSKRGKGYDTYRHAGTDDARGKTFKVNRENFVRSVKRNKILTKTGALKNSLKTSLRNNIAIISSSLPYSAIHNEGLMGKAWGKHPFKMPKRQFMGNSKSLERRSQAKFIAKINTAILNNK